ncbi:MAG: 3-isopropylmalate/(R)-2-methylmalate dehydratase small subunit [Candidatus Deianiraeaceae bacterium]
MTRHFIGINIIIFAMEKFKIVQSNVALLEIDNIDTDMIIPKQFLKTLKRTGLGKSLFYEMRYDENNNKVEDFVLNQKNFQKSQILISGNNFGCGSSREHAPWAIKDFGIKVIIANSFADIFYGNCFKNGILPIKLPESEISAIKEQTHQDNNFIVDLQSQTISSYSKNFVIKFKIDSQKKAILTEGLDDIHQTLKYSNLIDNFEENDKQQRPWIYG